MSGNWIRNCEFCFEAIVLSLLVSNPWCILIVQIEQGLCAHFLQPFPPYNIGPLLRLNCCLAFIVLGVCHCHSYQAVLWSAWPQSRATSELFSDADALSPEHSLLL